MNEACLQSSARSSDGSRSISNLSSASMTAGSVGPAGFDARQNKAYVAAVLIRGLFARVPAAGENFRVQVAVVCAVSLGGELFQLRRDNTESVHGEVPETERPGG